MQENQCVVLKSDMHARPTGFTVLCTPTDSSEKKAIDVFYYIVLLVSIIVW